MLFADVAGSTALGEHLDPELVRTTMSGYFRVARSAIERHGGMVEKFIGDAVMAVFGVPRLHEDDALRAVRAAMDLQRGLVEERLDHGPAGSPALGVRIGINTGDVIAGDPAAGETFVTGDTVNTAARLQQHADVDEVLLGASTYEQVRDAVDATPMPTLRLKGKSVPVVAYRLHAVIGDQGRRRRLEAPIVGRGEELAALQVALAHSRDGSLVQMTTVLGGPGVGKSRLITEFADRLPADVQIYRGRCLPYGEGVTYWPLREITRAASGIKELDDRSGAFARLRELLDGVPEADLIARLIASALGLVDEAAPQEDIFWAARKLLEHCAGDQPLVVIVEDIHWAEDVFLDLLEYVIDLWAGGAIMLVGTARPELLDQRPSWGRGRSTSALMRLEPLGDGATRALLDAQPGAAGLPEELRWRIVETAEGNPLYVEEAVAMLRDRAAAIESDEDRRRMLADLPVPPTVQALLTARIDALPVPERFVAARAAVAGRVFEAAALRELATGHDPSVASLLLSLVRRDIMRPARANLTAGDAFQFRHVLMRDAAYALVPKAERADLHERFADWLEGVAGDRLPEHIDVLAYHLERAYHLRREIGGGDGRLASLRERASRALQAAGQAAQDRGDTSGAVRALQPAWDLATSSAMRMAVAHGLAYALWDSGRPAEAASIARTSIEACADATTVEAMRLQLLLLEIEVSLEPAGAEERLATGLQDLEALRDDLDVATRSVLLGLEADLLSIRGREGEAAAVFFEAVRVASQAPWSRASVKFQSDALHVLLFEERPADDVAARCHEILDGAAPLSLRAIALRILGVTRVGQGAIEEGLGLLQDARLLAQSLGRFRSAAATAFFTGGALMGIGRDEEAATSFEDGVREFTAFGDRVLAAELGILLAHAVARQGDLARARQLLDRYATDVGEEDEIYQAIIALVQGLTIGGDNPDAAELQIMASIAMTDRTRYLSAQAAHRVDLARFLASIGRAEDARQVAEEAAALYDLKGYGELAERARLAWHV